MLNDWPPLRESPFVGLAQNFAKIFMSIKLGNAGVDVATSQEAHLSLAVEARIVRISRMTATGMMRANPEFLETRS
jgi:hypothetical protein